MRRAVPTSQEDAQMSFLQLCCLHERHHIWVCHIALSQSSLRRTNSAQSKTMLRTLLYQLQTWLQLPWAQNSPCRGLQTQHCSIHANQTLSNLWSTRRRIVPQNQMQRRISTTSDGPQRTSACTSAPQTPPHRQSPVEPVPQTGIQIRSTHDPSTC